MELPPHPLHPGEVLLELWLNGTSTESAARRAGMSTEEFSRLLDGRTPVSPSVAHRLETAGWATAGFWLRMQAHYDTSPARISA